jgi:DNA primase large subunit
MGLLEIINTAACAALGVQSLYSLVKYKKEVDYAKYVQSWASGAMQKWMTASAHVRHLNSYYYQREGGLPHDTYHGFAFKTIIMFAHEYKTKDVVKALRQLKQYNEMIGSEEKIKLEDLIKHEVQEYKPKLRDMSEFDEVA